MAAPYVATADIYVAPGVAAYRKGDVVNDALADHDLVKPFVSRAGTKAADAALPDAPPAKV